MARSPWQDQGLLPEAPSAYVDLRATTKAGYSTRIEAFRNDHGGRTVAGLTRERIVNGILQPYPGRPGASLSIIKMLRILIRYAIDIGWINHDPSLGIKQPKMNEIRSDKEIAVFEKRWPIGTKQRLAFALMLYTGQRRSDVHRMTWADVSDTTVQVGTAEDWPAAGHWHAPGTSGRSSGRLARARDGS